MDNDDRNVRHKHYKSNNEQHVVFDKIDMYSNTVMNIHDF